MFAYSLPINTANFKLLLFSHIRNLKSKQDVLLDQISFLTIERPFRNRSFDFDGFEESFLLDKNWKLDSEDLENDSSRETLKCEDLSSDFNIDKSVSEELELPIEPPCTKSSAYLCGSGSEKVDLVQEVKENDLVINDIVDKDSSIIVDKRKSPAVDKTEKVEEKELIVSPALSTNVKVRSLIYWILHFVYLLLISMVI